MGKMAASKMKGKHLNDAKSYIRKDVHETITPDSSACHFNFGDIAWVRTSSYTWWPAQVTPEKGVCPNSKPRKKAESEVLVRLYGTYNYLYIDPVKNNGEFENALKQKNSSIAKMLEEALETDRSRIEGRRKTKQNLPQSKESVTAGVSMDIEMWDGIERNEEKDSVACVGASSDEDKERGTNCTGKIVKARNHGSKSENWKQQYVRKQQFRKKDRGGTLGDTKLEENEKSGMSWTKDVDKANDICHGDKSTKNVKRTQAVKRKSGDESLEDLQHDEIKQQEVNEKIGSEVRQNQDGKQKTKQEDITKLGHNGVKEQKVKEKALCETSNKRVEKKRKPMEKTGHEAAKQNSLTQDNERKSKQQDGRKHDKADACGSGKHAQVGKTPDANARRTKVMKSLGLIAPSGSPFLKNGHVKAASGKS